jgi:hypothetical protein
MEDKTKEYARKLEKFEAEKAEKAKAFNITDLVASAKTLRKVEVEGVGEVQYGVLTLRDSTVLAKAESNEQRSSMMLWLMLRKAYPTLKLEDVEDLPMDVAAKILTAISRDMGFLTQPQTQ